MLAHGGVGSLGIAGRDGIDDLAVFREIAESRRSIRERQVTDPVKLRFRGVHDAPRRGMARTLEDHPVKVVVELVEPIVVARVAGPGLGFKDVAERCHGRRARRGTREPCRRDLQDFPDDRQALYLAGRLLFVARRWAEAVPYFEKALGVDPGAEWPLDDLVTALAVLGRRDELRGIVERAAREPPTPARNHAVVRARVWLGDLEGAVEAARRAVDQGGGPAAGLDLAGVLFVTGELAEAEAVLEGVRAAQLADGGTAYALARTLGAQGRIGEGLGVIDAYARLAEQKDQGVVQYARAMLVAGDAGPGVLWRETAKARALAPRQVPDLAVVLALRGDLPHAEEIAREAPAGTAAAEEYGALAAWRGGDAAGAAARLAALEAKDPWPPGVPPPAYLLAEVSADMADWRGTLAAVERYRALWPRGLSPAWTLPRAALLAARAREGLGETAAARGEVDRALAWMRHADPGLRTVREARTLRQRLGR